jgi:leucyl aminopeptidase
MIDYAALLLADKGQLARTIHIIPNGEFEDWLNKQTQEVRAIVSANRFVATPSQCLIIPGSTAEDWSLVMGAAVHSGVWDLASAVSRLPEGTYRLAGEPPKSSALGWLLAHYSFDRYLAKRDPTPLRVLLTSDVSNLSGTIRAAQATALVRDLVNTPAADMGPADLQGITEKLAEEHDATLTVTKGADLENGYPMIHAVGRAADKHHAPRLIELEWGNPNNPRIAVIGKGISFDSGGLNIKPGGSMRLMKKDMGGAAHALGLAKLVMEARLPVRLHMLIPAAENAISGNAFRPGDVLKSRNGLTVEIDNTDAEGRLVLADAITKAGDDKPELIIDYATLTGAARTALGPDLPALFANDHALATEINQASVSVDDPVWRLPLWSGYDDMLKSDVADVSNSAEGGMAGAITAALFLRKFVPADTLWVHLDTFAWRPSSKPGRPKGGDALGMRAVFEVLKSRYPVI